MSDSDKYDLAETNLALLVESTSIGSSSTAKVELRFLGPAGFITGELSSHWVSNLLTSVTVSLRLLVTACSILGGLWVVSKVSFKLGGPLIFSALGVARTVTGSL